MCQAMFQTDPRDTVTVGGQTRSVNPVQPRAVDIPLGTGMAEGARNAILTRRERLRIAEEG